MYNVSKPNIQNDKVVKKLKPIKRKSIKRKSKSK